MRIFNERGLSTLAVAGILLVISFLGTAVVYQLGISQVMRTNQVTWDSAFYVTQAGLEYAVRQIYEGETPVVAEPGKTFSAGNFIISQAGNVITVTGRSGGAQVVHSMTSPTQADCTRLDVSRANLNEDGDRLSQIKLRKLCLPEVVINQMVFSWVVNGGERVRRIRIESSTIYDDPSGTPSGGLIDVADYTMSNTNENVMNRVDFSANMLGKTFTLTLIFGDASTMSATFTPDEDD